MTSIIVATDGSSSGENAVQVAADIAKSRGAEVLILSVLDDKALPESIRTMARAEHLVDQKRLADESHIANIPTWMMKDLHGAAQADEDAALHQIVAELAVKRAQEILKKAGVTSLSEEIGSGDVADAIIDAAERHGADMIVMGSRGFGSLKSLVYGSTSRDVAKRAKCSCVSVT